MEFKIVGRTIGMIWMIVAILMLPSVFLAIYDRQPNIAWCYLASMTAMILPGGLLWYLCRNIPKKPSYTSEGIVTVGLAWLSISALSALPFCFTGEIPNYIDAFFEMVSGFTTTGASILRDVEALSRASLLWRSFSHWLGGMGMLVFVLAIAQGGKQSAGFNLNLMRAESPGPSVSKLTPRTRETARTLYFLYFILTVTCILFLLFGGLPFFDSLCLAFGTAGTGGFGILNDSCASYSPYIQNVLTVFMALFGVNFGVYYLIILKKFSAAFADEEVRLYLSILAAAILLITFDILPMTEGGFWTSLRYAAFQVSSITTTTGFSTTDFNLWPTFSKSILLVLMVCGACAGSTGGGIKTARLLLLGKAMFRSIRRTLRPRSVQLIQINKRPVEESVIHNAGSYLTAYWALMLVSIILVALDGMSMESTVSAVFACFNNIGPGFGEVGPVSNFADCSVFTKLVLSADMLLGRLEIFPLLTLFSRYTWSKKV